MIQGEAKNIRKLKWSQFYTLLTSIVTSLFISGCAQSLDKEGDWLVKSDTLIHIPGYAQSSELSIQYLGAGGLLIEHDTSAILIDPFFSNPGPFISLLWKNIESDPESIDKAFEHIDVSKVKTLLVTHAHYDHLMDVPYIYEHYLHQDTEIWGSTTTAWILKYHDLPYENIRNVESFANMGDKAGQWLYNKQDSSFRIMPVMYQHAPHLKFLGWEIKLYDGCHGNLPDKVRKTNDWKEGQMLGFIIDLLDEEGNVKNRIQILSGGAENQSSGFIPVFAAPDQRKVDIMAMVFASHNYVKGYPEEIINGNKPDYIVATHWEDIFLPYHTEEKKTMRLTDAEGFIEIMEENMPGKWVMAYPLRKIRFTF
jgi:hypothetical protein